MSSKLTQCTVHYGPWQAAARHVILSIGGDIPKFLGAWAKSAANGSRTTNDLYATTLGSATNRKHCVMSVKFNKEWKTLRIWLTAAIEIFHNY